VTAPVRLRTSRDSPLGIAELLLGPGEGRLGLTICPGKKDRSRQWDRDLGEDLKVIRDWGATTVVTLIEDDEFRLLGIEDLGATVRRHGMAWVHLPIRDVDVPDDRFERAWAIDGPALHRRIDRGEGILIHCRGGLGRTGLVAGLILVERGVSPPEAIDRVRAARPHAIETWAQEGYVLNAKPREAPQDEGSSPWRP
jgi:ADP-ribosyl-[dinitrogen reductase] hydrolase